MGMSSFSSFSSATLTTSDFSGASAATGVVASSRSLASACRCDDSWFARSSSEALAGAFLEAGAGWSSLEGDVTLWRVCLTTSGGDAGRRRRDSDQRAVRLGTGGNR